MKKQRTYWQGASGTYCDMCFWGTDRVGIEGAALWTEHCNERHPHVSSPN